MKLLTNRIVNPALLSLLAIAIAGSPASAQDVSMSLYTGAGPDGHGLSAAAGVRVEVAGVWGGYARAALRSVTNLCLTSIPAKCNYPEGDTHEYAAGVVRTFDMTSWRGSIGAGGGVISWQDELDPFVDLSAQLRRPILQQVSLIFGVNAILAPGVEREPQGTRTIVSNRFVFFPNAVLGLAFQVW